MNRKCLHTVIILLLTIFNATGLMAQEIKSYIADARSAYQNENWNETRINLQKALNEIEKAIAQDILAILPQNLGNLNSNNEKDDVEGSAGIAGLFVSRTYGSKDEKYAELVIADNSPMMAMISGFLSSPLLAGISAAGGGQKSVNINGYKAVLQEEEGSGEITIMVPFGDTLISLESNNGTEQDVIAMMEQIPLVKIEDIVD